MPSYLYATDGLKMLVKHSADPTKQLDNVQLVVCELNSGAYSSELYPLIVFKGGPDLRERREAVQDLWLRDQQTLSGDSTDGAVSLLSQCFSQLNRTGRTISLTVVGRTQGWHSTAEDDQVWGSKAYTSKLNELDACLDKKAFKDGDCVKVMVKLFEASHDVSAPIKSLALDLQNGYHSSSSASNGALQKMSDHSGKFLPVLERLDLRLKISAPNDGLDDVSEASSGTMVEEMSDCETEISHDAISTFEAISLGGCPSPLSQLDLTMCGPAVDNDAYNLTLDSINKGLGNAYFQEIALHQGRFDALSLQGFLESHSIGLKTLILDDVQLQSYDSWRASLKWMVENLTLDVLELHNLKATKCCTKFARQLTKVLCGLCGDGAWVSYRFFDGAEKVAEGLEYLVDIATGQYKWLDRLVEGRTKPLMEEDSD
ncbi:hypothetical protein LTR78_000192 [Recurvomyces mirabilis]|uniref:Uncharacterized protein n=1 Tax=Recurvomyces mirabilis TaxID=574656 RepID=A0AAE0WXP0_9PEZI|nr:hypothetical protein LTR78_000192 [Recurvomyces mirabilis]KAK5161849.1 hypothetical protein LTS14_000194 [Recurvomyces mirabilis]